MKARARTGTRRERALETRRRILAAAYELFCARGYAGTTMEAIARQSGVAVQTMYFTFHTKAALLEEVEGAAVVGFETWKPPSTPLSTGDPAQLRAFHTWFGPFEAAKTAHEALEIFLDGGVEIMERAGPLVSTIREAIGDPDARAVYELGEVRRADAYQAVVRVLGKKPPGLRQGLTVRRATDVLFTVFSEETYQMLRRRGWKQREVHAWLLDVLGQQLLAS